MRISSVTMSHMIITDYGLHVHLNIIIKQSMAGCSEVVQSKKARQGKEWLEYVAGPQT